MNANKRTVSFEFEYGFDWSAFYDSLRELGGENWEERGFGGSVEFDTGEAQDAFLWRATELANTHGIVISVG